MAFDKMTTEQLYMKFLNCMDILRLGAWNSDVDYDGSAKSSREEPVKFRVSKVGARQLKIDYDENKVLYFLWYSDDNWTIGTKIYRKRPRCMSKKSLEPVRTVTSVFALVPTYDGSGDVRIACANPRLADSLILHIRQIIAKNGHISLEEIKDLSYMKPYYTDTHYIWDDPNDFKQEIENGVEYVRFHLNKN